MPTVSPATDTHLIHKYSYNSLEQKIRNKTALQEELGWPEEPKVPMICLPAGMTEALGGETLKALLPGLLSATNAQLLILGKGSAEYGTLFTKIQKEHRHRIAIIAEKETDVHRMYAAADMALFLTAPLAKELTICLSYGVIPVSTPADVLENYNPIQEAGNAFLIEGRTEWHAFAALVRAIETYKFPYDWRTIQKHAMESVKK
jgi:starch synthase